METNKIIQGDALTELKKLPNESINCCMTSPPYWALRNYKTEGIIWDAKEGCEHDWNEYKMPPKGGHCHPDRPPSVGANRSEMEEGSSIRFGYTSNFCSKCGAWKGSLGLEPTFDLYIKHLCDIFDEVKRVLRKDGTCWINLGDTYGTKSGSGFANDNLNPLTPEQIDEGTGIYKANELRGTSPEMHKNLCNIPARFSIEMQNRGWILRNVIIWKKSNCMPSSTKDRFTVDFEYLFFFVKNKKYWFETQYEKLSDVTVQDINKRKNMECLTGEHGSKHFDNPESAYNNQKTGRLRTDFVDLEKGRNKRTVWAIDEDRLDYLTFKLYEIKTNLRNGNLVGYQGKSVGQDGWNEALNNAKSYRDGLKILQQQEVLSEDELEYFKDYVQNHFGNPQGRNKRAVWTINTKPFKEAHFAVYPPELIETPIKAGCPEFVCNKCGFAREKIEEREGMSSSDLMKNRDSKAFGERDKSHWQSEQGQKQNMRAPREAFERKIINKGYTNCGCKDNKFEGGIVLDPFFGAGTTGLVALKQNKQFIGIELNPKYIEIAKKRLEPYLTQTKLGEVK